MQTYPMQTRHRSESRFVRAPLPPLYRGLLWGRLAGSNPVVDVFKVFIAIKSMLAKPAEAARVPTPPGHRLQGGRVAQRSRDKPPPPPLQGYALLEGLLAVRPTDLAALLAVRPKRGKRDFFFCV